ncbi:aldo/keto reductase [Clostridioides sp. ZZV14-6150]|uniref:aldo/keto reductase n=1 Tax=unclassified Clostridioides TaxID=2635829 RepID=UPI001D11D0D8|nr:aldo/keto reductase [Clostridioides sp. ZZV14-6150]MCC0722138.1 aldo/keto reductase [Clostridioides sp. ZZV14-6104]MCC0752332.1 aldo/keto reductase [Clostridioides sp. ZZV13-5731]
MRYVEYGKTGKMVSVVGYGGLRFDLEKSDQENADLIKYAYEKGINYFDTAPGYCDDRSEDIFGLAFRQIIKGGKTDFYVSTKGKPKEYDTAEKAIDAVKKSIERLGVSKINFYHIWNIRKMEHYEFAMRPGGQYEGLLKCKEEGLIDHIVFSSHQPGDEVIKVLDENKFEGVTMGINILNFPYRLKGAKHAVENGYGVVAMNPLSGGTIPKYNEELSFLAREGESTVESALRFNIGIPQINISLIGVNKKQDIDDACKIADENKIYSDKDIHDIETRLSKNMNEICTGCGYCKVCPKDINTPAYMLFYNEKQMFKKSDEEMIKSVYGLAHWNYTMNSKAKAKECIACGKCEIECTQHLPIIARLKEIKQWEENGVNNVTV